MNKEQIFDIRINTACGKKCGWFKEGDNCKCCGIVHINNKCLLFDEELYKSEQYWECKELCKLIAKQLEADE
jgi:hypothetical protein